MSKTVEVNWQLVEMMPNKERVEEYLGKYWAYMDEHKLESDSVGEREAIIKRLRGMSGYEQVKGERGKANVLNHLTATQTYVQAALGSMDRASNAVEGESEVAWNIGVVISHLKDAQKFLEEAMSEIEG